MAGRWNRPIDPAVLKNIIQVHNLQICPLIQPLISRVDLQIYANLTFMECGCGIGNGMVGMVGFLDLQSGILEAMHLSELCLESSY